MTCKTLKGMGRKMGAVMSAVDIKSCQKSVVI